ncbi:MAG TPA: IPT/TIG domain-containing protein [Candidatus Dormibacteraeota bacterium]
MRGREMRKLRAAVIGFMVALPAALALPAAVPVAASTPSCGGIVGSSFGSSLQQPYGGTSGIVINGSFGTLQANYSNGGTVYFSGPGGSPDTSAAVSFSSGNTSNGGNTLTVNAPGGAYSGHVWVCISGNNQVSDAGLYTFDPKVVGSYAANEGKSVAVSGNFYNSNLSVSVGGCPTGYSWVNESSINVSAPAPADCSGAVSVSEKAWNGAPLSGSGGSFKVTPSLQGVQCASPCYPGSTVTISGNGFSNSGTWSFGPASGHTSDGGFSFPAPDVESAALGLTTGNGSSVSSPALGIAPHITGVSAVSEGQTATVSGQAFGGSGTVSVGGQPASGATWSNDQIQFVMPAGVAPQVALTRDDGQQASAQFTLIPVITSVSPASAAPGSYVEISGSGFGSNPTVTIGGVPAQVALPGDTGIAATVPSGAKSGKLIVNSSYGKSVAWGQTFTVLGAGAAGSGSTGSSGGFSNYGNSNSGTLNVKPNYGFLPLPAPPPGVAFHLTAPSDQVKPGSDVPLTVNLQLLGKPVAGSTITFQVADSPGSDTSLSSPSTTTDATGTAHVTLHTSKKAGQTIVIARSGAFADQIRIVTLSPVAANAGIPATVFRNGTIDPHILIPFVGALGLAILLLLGAVLLQLRLNRRSPAPVAAAVSPAVETVAEPPKPKAPRKPRAQGAAPRKRPARPQPAPPPEVSVMPMAAGAEDIADVIPLPTVGDAADQDEITRTRARAKRPE